MRTNGKSETARGPRADGSRRARYLLVSYPAVQIVRFATKIALGVLLGAADFGEAMQVGILVFFVSHLAYAGLDEALVAGERIDQAAFARLRRFHLASGAAAALLAALLGSWLAALLGRPELRALAWGLAPMIALANVSVLPMALLVRERRYRDVFWVEVSATAGLGLATVAAALLGLRSWSLVAGWYANAALVVVLAERFARARIAALPARPPDGAAAAELLRHGRRFMGSSVLGFATQRIDAFLVGAVLGPVALGLYELAQHMAQAFVQYAQSLVERFLFPRLSEERRNRAAAPTFGQALRFAVVFVLPLHLVLAWMAEPLVALLLPADWLLVWPILAALAVAAAFQCLEMVPVSALKGVGRTDALLGLSAARAVLTAAAVLLALPTASASAVALAVAGSRVVSFALSLATARSFLLDVETRTELCRGVLTFLSWAGLLLPMIWLIARVPDGRPLLQGVAQGAAAGVSWLVVRAVRDRPALLKEWHFVSHRVAAALAREDR